MPLVKISGQLIYFAHVPKCAGSAVEFYLLRRFGPLGLRDGGYLSEPASRRWSRTSPQHIHRAALDRLLPPAFMDHSFAVVRDPAERIASVFRFQRDVERTLPRDAALGDWLDGLPELWRKRPFHMDNHIRPMDDFVPNGATVFRAEDRLEGVVAWLDQIAGDTDGPRDIMPMNTYAQRQERGDTRGGPKVRLTRAMRRKIAELFAVDYERFGYSPDI